MSVNSLGYLSGLTTDFTNVRAMGDFAVDGVLTVQNFSANSLTGHLSANTVNAESGNTIGLLAALSTNTLAPGSGNTLRIVNGADMIARSYDSGGAVFNIRAFGAVGDGVVSDKSAILSALVAASASGRGGVAYVPPGTYDVGSGLSLVGHTAALVGSGTKDCIIKASTQSGAVIDLRDWSGEVTNNQAQVMFGGFQIHGSGLSSPTRANIGLDARGITSTRFFNIGIKDTGGPCLSVGSQWNCIFEGVTLNRPINADLNDVPYFEAVDWLNACLFHGLLFRSIVTTPDGKAVLVIEENDAATHDTLFSGTIFEFQHTPENSSLISVKANGVVFRDTQFFDCSSASVSATGNSFFRFSAGTLSTSGGNELNGVIPGRDTGTGAYAYGVILGQSRNRLVGVRGFRDNNVRIDSGVSRSYIEFGGSRSGTGTSGAVEDNSGHYSNVIFDHTARAYTYGGATLTGGASEGAQGSALTIVTVQQNTAGRRGLAVQSSLALSGVASRHFTVCDNSGAEVFGVGHQGVTKPGYLYLVERSAPGAPAANEAYIYLKDNGLGNTVLTMRLAANAETYLSSRTIAASALTVSAANSTLSTNEVVFTVGGASGASLAIHSGGTVYIFSSALSAKAT